MISLWGFGIAEIIFVGVDQGGAGSRRRLFASKPWTHRSVLKSRTDTAN
jgi:hypothetical protein